MRSRHAAHAIAVLVSALATPLAAQSGSQRVRADASAGDVGAYLEAHRLELRIEGGRLAGPAAAWLREAAADAQFVFVGEEHDVREIPIALRALWPDLAALGFTHVALEAGQWLGNRLEAISNGDSAAVADFVAGALPHRPNISVPPASVEDLELVRALGVPPGGPRPRIWGIDQEFRLARLLQRLSTVAHDGDARRAAGELAAAVTAAERAGRFDLTPFRPALTTLLRSATPAFRDAGDLRNEEWLLRDALRRRLDDQRGEVTRELFLRDYRAAQRSGERRPRVLLRFGAYHASRGLMADFRTSTLANFVAELAHAERLADRLEGVRDVEALPRNALLTIAFVSCDTAPPTRPGSWLPPAGSPAARRCSARERRWLPALQRAAAYEWTLFDLRPLRRWGAVDPLFGEPGASAELLDVSGALDAVIVLRRITRGRVPQ